MTNKLKGETIWVRVNYSLVSHWLPSCSCRPVTSVVHLLIVTGCPTGKLCHPMNAFSIWSHYKYSTTPIWTVMPQPDIVFQYFLFNCTSFQHLFWIVEWTRGTEIDGSKKEGKWMQGYYWDTWLYLHTVLSELFFILLLFLYYSPPDTFCTWKSMAL